MKTLICIVLAGITLLLSLSSYAQGHDVGNGGDSMVISIREIGRDIERKWKGMTAECIQKIPLQVTTYSASLNRARVETTNETLFINGVLKEAVNYPSKNKVIFNRSAFTLSDKKAQLVVHEILGLAGASDEDYELSKLIVNTVMEFDCSRSVSGEASNVIPFTAAIDAQGVVYYSDLFRDQIFAYDTRSKKSLAAIKIRAVPIKLMYSRSLDRLYIAYSNRRITKVDLSRRIRVEEPFAILTGAETEVAVVGSSLVVSSRDRSSARHYIYDAEGRMTENRDGSALATHMAPSPSGEHIFFISSRVSPTDLFVVKIVGDKFINQRGDYRHEFDSPYHGDYEMIGPVIAGEQFVAIGSGHVFSVNDLSLKGSLPKAIVGGQWINGHLWAVDQLQGGFTVSKWNQTLNNEVLTQSFEGAYVSLLDDKGTPVLLYVDADDKLQISRDIKKTTN